MRKTAPDDGMMYYDAGPALDLRSVLDVLKRRYLIFGGIILLAIAASIAVILYAQPQFTAEARVKIDPRQQSIVSTQGGLTPGGAESAVVDTEVTAIQSPDVARAVVRQLGLANDPEFTSNPGPGAVDEAAQALQERVKISRSGLTYSISIRATSPNPQKAARIANAVADAYIDLSREQRVAMAADQAKSLEAELGSLGSNVTAADERVAGLRGQAGIVASSDAGGTVTDQQITTIASQLAQADSDAAAANATAGAAKAQIATQGIETVSQVLNSPALVELRTQRAQALRDQAQISANAGPKHPSYVRAEEQLRRVNREISDEAGRIVSGLESDARAANARAAALRGQLTRLQAEQSNNARAAVTVNSLERNADAMRTTYNEMNRNALVQTQEARIGSVRASVVTRATAPLNPSSPNKPLFLALGLLLGLGSASGAVIVLEMLGAGLRTAEEVEAALDLTVLGVVPELDPKQLRELNARETVWDYVVKRPTSAFAESLRGVRSALMLSRGSDVPKVVTITSTLPAEGKTTTAISLARVMALAGDRVLLIDCDLRRNSLGPLRQEPSQCGLVEILDGECKFEDSLYGDQSTNLDLLLLSENLFTPRDMFSGTKMRDLLASVESRYDFILLDAPPALALADARMLSAVSDATIMAVRCVRTPAKAIRAAITRLQDDGAYIAGTILTRVSRAQGLSSSDPSYYAKAYRDYYQG